MSRTVSDFISLAKVTVTNYRWLAVPTPAQIRLGADPQPIADFLTAEDLQLFGREPELAVEACIYYDDIILQ